MKILFFFLVFLLFVTCVNSLSSISHFGTGDVCIGAGGSCSYYTRSHSVSFNGYGNVTRFWNQNRAYDDFVIRLQPFNFIQSAKAKFTGDYDFSNGSYSLYSNISDDCYVFEVANQSPILESRICFESTFRCDQGDIFFVWNFTSSSYTELGGDVDCDTGVYTCIDYSITPFDHINSSNHMVFMLDRHSGWNISNYDYCYNHTSELKNVIYNQTEEKGLTFVQEPFFYFTDNTSLRFNISDNSSDFNWTTEWLDFTDLLNVQFPEGLQGSDPFDLSVNISANGSGFLNVTLEILYDLISNPGSPAIFDEIPPLSDFTDVLTSGASVGVVAEAWNPYIYPSLSDTFKSILSANSVEGLINDIFKVLPLLFKYIFRQPATLVAGGGL